MSKSYVITGTRFQRLYKAEALTSSYAASADAATIASNLCDVKWTESDVRTALFPMHGGKTANDEANINNRGLFDAAMFCAEHDVESGRHRAYAQAACYRFTIPETGLTLQSLTAAISCDPYTPDGARVAIFTSDDAVPPMKCVICRTGTDAGTAATTTASDSDGDGVNDTWTTTGRYADHVAPRRVVTPLGGSATWYVGSGNVVFNPTGGVALSKYLFVFVLLENYNTSRSGYLEGSSYIQPKISVTLDSSVSSWDSVIAGGASSVDTSYDQAGTTPFDVFSGTGSFLQVVEGRFALAYESPRCGVEFPVRTKINHVLSSPGPSKSWSPLHPSSTDHSEQNVKILGFTSLCHQDFGRTGASRYHSGFAVSYDPSSSESASSGLSFYVLWKAATGSVSTEDSYDSFTWTQKTPSAQSGYTFSPSVSSMLSSGDVNRIFVVPSFRYTPASSSSPDPEWTTSQVGAFAVIVSGKSGCYVAGYLMFPRSFSQSDAYYGTTPQNLPLRFCSVSSDMKVSDSQDIVLCSRKSGDVSQIASIPLVSHGADVMVSSGSVSFLTSAYSQLSDLFVVESRDYDGGKILSVPNGLSVYCEGKDVFVTDIGSRGNVAVVGHSAYSCVAVSGDITSVGGESCRMAVVDMNPGSSYSSPVVMKPSYHDNIPSYDGVGVRITPVVSGGVFCAASIAAVGFLSRPMIDGRMSFYIGLDGSVSTMDSSFDGWARNVWSGSPNYMVFRYEASYETVYSASPYDSILTGSSDQNASIGVRSCYSKFYRSDAVKIPFDRISRPKASFVLRATSESIKTTQDYGSTVSTVSIPKWRISASPALMPISLPSEKTPKVMRLSWTALSAATQGSYLNVWANPGKTVKRYDEYDLSDPEFYMADSQTVQNDWVLVGRIPANGTSSADFDILGKLGSDTATLLFTAWMPQDGINPPSSSVSSVGVGTIDVSVSGSVIVGDSNGWLPSVSLLC